MLFQYNGSGTTLCSCGLIICVKFAQEVVSGIVCRVTTENDTVAKFARSDTKWLEEFVLHGCFKIFSALYDRLRILRSAALHSE